MEATEMKLKGPSETVSEEIIPAQSRPAVAEFLQQTEHRGLKRSRRERGGSSAKERISKMPACVPGKRSSIYRGVTRHRWTGRYEAHLWDKNTWNEAQNKKGKQVYLGAYDDEEAAARAYDLAALKYWGPGTLINFPVTDYARDVEEMQSVSREEYLVSLRRKGSSTKQKAFTRHLSMRRWEDRLGHVLGNKYLQLGNPSTPLSHEDAAVAFDMQALEYRGINAASNLDLSRYITWLRPERSAQPATTSLGAGTTATGATTREEELEGAGSPASESDEQSQPEGQQQARQLWPGQASEPYQLPSLGIWHSKPSSSSKEAHLSGAPSALSLLLSSSIFKSMRERTALTEATNEAETKFCHAARFLADAPPQTSRFYEEPGSSELFSPDVHYEMSVPPSYASQEGTLTQAGPMYSQSTPCWDPFLVQPLTAQQLSSC